MENNWAIRFRKVLIPMTIVGCLILFGCSKDETKSNNPPTAILSVTNPSTGAVLSSGDVPFSARFRVDGTDPDGSSDLKSYRLTVGSKSFSKIVPIDTVMNFVDADLVVDVSGEVFDSKNATNKSSIVLNTYKGPFIDQSAALINDVNVNYSATLSKVALANLVVTRDGAAFFTKDLSSNYTNVFKYDPDKFTKGSYDFVLKSGSLEKKSTVVVPNYLPTLDVFSIPNLTEFPRTTANKTLPTPSDKNPEDVPTYVSARSIDGKVSASLNGNVLSLTPVTGSGSYSVELTFGSESGGLEKKVVTGTIAPDSRIVVYAYNDNFISDCYGSGDLNLDGKVNSTDVSLLSDLIAGKTIPNADKRLTDRADITGDTYINNDDLTIVQKFVNGQSNYLPNQINKSTRAEGVAWIRKMMTINNLNVDEIVSKGGDCNEFARQLVINFNTLSSEELSKLTASFPYDLSNAGRFKNINMRAAAQFFYKSGEDSANLGIIPYAGHQMNVVLLGNDARDIKNLCFVDGQSHTVIDAANNVWLPGIVDVNFGQGYLDGRNTLLDIRGSPVSSGGIMAPYVLWKVVDNVPTKLDWESDVVKFVSSR